MKHEAFISMDTGRIYWVSSVGAVEDELPDDLEESDRYVAIPHKNDFDLGRTLALRIADAELPNAYGRARDCFGHRGAYACFKALLAAHGCLDRWYAFERSVPSRPSRTGATTTRSTSSPRALGRPDTPR